VTFDRSTFLSWRPRLPSHSELADVVVFIALGLALLSGFRMGLIGFHEGFSGFSVLELRKTLQVGFQFDLKILATLGLLGLLLQSLLARAGLLFGYLTVCVVLVVLSSLCQHFYFQFYKSAFSPLVFGLWEDDTQALLSTITRNYPVFWILLLASALVLLTLLAHGTLARRVSQSLRWYKASTSGKRAVVSVAALFLMLLASRGSLGRFPLVVDDSVVTTRRSLNESVKNAPYALFSAWNERRSQIDYRPEAEAQTLARYGFSSRAKLAEALGRRFDDKDPQAFLYERVPAATTNPVSHVVFTLMESWGAWFFDFQSKDNDLLGAFASHRQQDYFSTKFLSAQSGTHSAVEALLINSPLSPVTSGDLAGHRFGSAAARPFKEAGYVTYFIYGGSAAWRSIGKAMSAQSFDHVFDMADIQQRFPEARKGTWGIDDEYLFAFALEKIKELEAQGKKSLVFLLTTTNHPPHSTPDHFAPKPLNWTKFEKVARADAKEGLETLKTFQYSNHHMGEFLGNIKSSSLAEKTVVAATGDHSLRVFFQSSLPSDALRLYSVPAYFYIPKALRPNLQWQDGFAGHRDLFPTLYHLALPGAVYPAFGRSLFAPRPIEEQFAMHDSHMIFSQEGMVDIKGGRDSSKRELNYAWDKDDSLLSTQTLGKPRSETLEKQRARAVAVLAAQEWLLRSEIAKAKETSSSALGKLP
jgi:phosphoglycerol transferase MdoB-like AlkP superfamily enzyme